MEVADQVEFNKNICRNLASKAKLVGVVLEQARPVESIPTVESAVKRLLQCLENIKKFVLASKEMGILKRIIKKDKYLQDCEQLIFDLETCKEFLMFALTCQIYNRIENDVVPGIDKLEAVATKQKKVEAVRPKGYQH